MAEFLLEILCEEIPARMQVRAGADLAKALSDGLTKAGLSVDGAQTFTGPRRLAFSADIALRSPDVSEERKGPKVGSPEQALAGFIRGAGLTDISQAETRTDPKKGEFYVAIIKKDGRDSTDILAELIPTIMQSFPWPKSMKSGSTSFRWVRPLTSIICLLDSKVVDFEVGGVKSSNVTHGHRRLGAGPFTVSSLSDYSAQLESGGHVVLSAEHRKDTILTDARKACAAKGLELVEDEGLLNEVAGLAEWPVVILGDMDPSFLDLPAEVIRLSMRTHQKYFAVKDPKTGKLAPNFIVVANQAAPDGGIAIAQGNSRVLSARLSDALFFEQQDAKLKLEDYYEKLDTVVFHKKLGSIKDKAERVAALAKELAKNPSINANPDAAEQAAKLAKCDLVTNMVIEFTSLQGQIGRLMYERENHLNAAHPAEGPEPSPKDSPAEPQQEMDPVLRRDERVFSEADKSSIAIAIEDHYKPQGPSDSVPTNPVAIAVALADKLDTLEGFWAIDEKPTGSKDPYALRRAALGVVRIILENEIQGFIGMHFTQVAGSVLIGQFVDFDAASGNLDNLKQQLKEKDVFQEVDRKKSLNHFLIERFRSFLHDQHYRLDIIEAVLKPHLDIALIDLNDNYKTIKALQTFLSTDDGTNLLAGYKRAANILRAEAKKDALPDMDAAIDTALLSDASEKALHTALGTAKPAIDAALAEEDYAGAMSALASLRAPIDAFFDSVMVNDDNVGIRANRLRLLGLIRQAASAIADFDKIDG